MIVIENIKIKRYRSINDLELKIDSSHNVVTLCGQNNVGKTNILRAISLFFNKTEFVFEEDVPEFKQMTRGASIYPHITLKMTNKKNNDVYTITKDFNLKKLNKNSKKQYVIEGFKNKNKIHDEECEEFLNSLNVFFLPSINISFPETINYLIDDKFLDIEFGKSKMKGKKGEVKEYLEKARTTLQEILDDLTSSIDPIFKEFHDKWGIKFIVPKDINRFREILNEEIEFVLLDDTKSEIKSKGSGLQRLGHILLNFRIIEKLTNSNKDCLLLIDEPDIYLHTRLQKKLYHQLLELSKKTQVFITTHSPLFIDGYNLKNLFLIELDVTTKYSTRKKKEGNILNTRLVDTKKGDYIFLIKEILGIEDTDNLIIGNKNLIVEGEIDKKYITELINFFKLQMCNIISAGGVTNYKKYLEFYDTLAKKSDVKPKFILLYDNDNEGREVYKTLKNSTYENIDVSHHFIIDAYNTDLSNVNQNNCNIEIEDFIYPEIILELANKILSKKDGFNKIRRTKFLESMNNKSMRITGVLNILNNLKNEANPELGIEFSTKDMSFKNGVSNIFQIKGDQDMINKLTKLDKEYPYVRKFLTNLLNA
jgi:predicted ATP-dependent endonuclease of OLD family